MFLAIQKYIYLKIDIFSILGIQEPLKGAACKVCHFFLFQILKVKVYICQKITYAAKVQM